MKAGVAEPPGCSRAALRLPLTTLLRSARGPDRPGGPRGRGHPCRARGGAGGCGGLPVGRPHRGTSLALPRAGVLPLCPPTLSMSPAYRRPLASLAWILRPCPTPYSCSTLRSRPPLQLRRSSLPPPFLLSSSRAVPFPGTSPFAFLSFSPAFFPSYCPSRLLFSSLPLSLASWSRDRLDFVHTLQFGPARGISTATPGRLDATWPSFPRACGPGFAPTRAAEMYPCGRSGSDGSTGARPVSGSRAKFRPGSSAACRPWC